LLKPNLLGNKIWKNLKGTIYLSFKEDKDIKGQDYNRLIGVVFRAQSFEDYFMLEIWKIGNQISIRPHVRVNGNWDAPLFDPKVNSLKIEHTDTEFKLEFTVIEGKAELFVRNIEGKLIWMLPSVYEINLKQHPDDQGGTGENEKEGVVKEIPFLNSPGRFGFRNYGNEIAVIKSLKITPLDSSGRVVKNTFRKSVGKWLKKLFNS